MATATPARPAATPRPTTALGYSPATHGPLLAIIARRRRYARSVATSRVTAALRRVA